MPDAVSEVTRRSWGSRLKGSFKGIVVGLLLVAGAFFVLFKNEGRAVRRHRALNEGGRAVVAVDAGSVLPGNDGKLVHVSGVASPGDALVDPDFGVATLAVHLDRDVEMYQWIERAESRTEKKTGGATETTTTYAYSRGWADRWIDSSQFKNPAGHANPRSMPYGSRRFSAENVTVGAFRLGPSLIDRIRQDAELPVRSLAGLPRQLQGRARLDGGGIYVGIDPAAPQIGDLRVRFRHVEPTTVSIVAQQSGQRLLPYRTRSGGSLELLRIGAAGPGEMIEAAKEANKTLTWVLRLLGFLLMTFGLRTILAPLAVFADVLPALGYLVGKGVTFLGALIALPLALVTISVAWIFYRPLLAAGVLALAAVGALAVLRTFARARSRARAAPAAQPSA